MTSSGVQRSLDKVEALRKTPLFSGLSDVILQKAASCSIVKQLNAGEVLFSEHDKAMAMYVVVDGELRSVRQNSKGREQVLSTERAGAVLAVAPIFNDGRFYSTTIADTPAHVLCIRSHDVQALCKEHAELLWALCSVFAHKLRKFAELIETLALRNVDQRVAQYLLNICEERGKHVGAASQIELTMTHSELASRIGSTREVVCRALGHLERQGLIQTVRTKHLNIPDVHELRRYAGIQDSSDEQRPEPELSSDIA